MWAEKHRPKRPEDLVGNEEARLALALWLSKWKPGAKAALLLGPPGTGKTTFIGLLAAARGMNLVDLNASDVRTKEKLRRRMGEAMETVSIFGERSLIFLDEVDGIAGRADIGAVDFIKESAKASRNPIVMAANDPDSDEIKKLSSSCITFRFKSPPPREIEMYLRHVAAEEGIELEDEEFRAYARDSGGDMRHAVNLLQSRPAIGGEPKRRDYSKDIDRTLREAFDGFFGAVGKAEAAASLRAASMSPFEKVREIQRSVLRSGLPVEEMARALEVVSRADLLIGKMMRAGDWRLLRYLDRLFVEELYPLLRGSGAKYTGQQDDTLPFPVMVRIWNDSRKITEISLRFASRARTSGKSARSQDLPYVFLLCSGSAFREGFEHALGLDADPDVLESYDKFLKKEAAR